jgi:hypothetical protein
MKFTADAMRTVRRAVVLAVALVGGARGVEAQVLSVSGSPAPLGVTLAAAGSAPTADVDNSTTYSIFVLSFTQRKIVAQLNSPTPPGVTLSVQLQAPGGGATSLGLVPLTTVAKDVVTGITFAWTTRTITYQLDATVAAGVVPVQSRTVTLTVVAAP